jgi:hypothetical protein
MAAAVAVSCLDPDYPPQLRSFLIVSWLELQNVPDAAFQELCAYVYDCPEAFLDSAELLCTRERTRRLNWLEKALIAAGRHPRVAQAINLRLRSWLGRWSRVPRKRFHADPNGVEQARTRAEQITLAHDRLTACEQSAFDKLCTEVAHREDMDMDSLGFKLLIGKPLESFADVFLAWSLAAEIAGDYRSAYDEGAWLLRLNVIDPKETEQAILKTARSFLTSEASVTAKEAVAVLLRMVGSEETTEIANSLSSPPEVGHGWRRVENFCDTDPVDPNSAFPTNLRNAEDLLRSIPSEEVWSNFSRTEQDLNLETVWRALVRFNPDILINKIRDITATADHRRGMALRQLTFRPRLLSRPLSRLAAQRGAVCRFQ